MRDLKIERLEMVQGGASPDASCVIKHGLAGAASGAVVTAITGMFVPAGILGGWGGGLVEGLINCPWT